MKSKIALLLTFLLQTTAFAAVIEIHLEGFYWKDQFDSSGNLVSVRGPDMNFSDNEGQTACVINQLYAAFGGLSANKNSEFLASLGVEKITFSFVDTTQLTDAEVERAIQRHPYNRMAMWGTDWKGWISLNSNRGEPSFSWSPLTQGIAPNAVFHEMFLSMQRPKRAGCQLTTARQLDEYLNLAKQQAGARTPVAEVRLNYAPLMDRLSR